MDIQAVSPEIGYAAGNQGAFLRTSSAGTNWQLLEFPRRMNIRKICFLNEETGWIVGKKDSLVYLYKTRDGGASWTKQLQAKADRITFDFIDECFGWASIDSTFYQTRDGGVNWQIQSAVNRKISEIQFLDQTTGWAVGGNNVYKTSDGANSWAAISLKDFGFFSFSLNKVRFVNANIGWVSGTSSGPNHASGHLIRTTDGGINWQQQSSGIYMKASDGRDLYILDENHGYAVAGDILLKTTTGGKSWNPEQVNNFGHQTFYLRSVFFKNPQLGWAGSSFGGGWGGLLRTTDGGKNWTVQIDSVVTILDICFANAELGWFVSNQEIYHTSDGGDSWFIQFRHEVVSFASIFFTTPDSGWAGGLNGLLRTTDGGATWEETDVRDMLVEDVCFLNPKEGWIVGWRDNDSMILKTSNGGLSWKSQTHSAPIYARPQSVYFADQDHGWVVGEGFQGKILYTSNGGDLWEPIDFAGDSWLYEIQFVGDHGWIMGSGGSIFHTTLNEVIPVEQPPNQGLPSNFSMKQNYPNPFNPTTMIEYFLPRTGRVQLSIFNEMGGVRVPSKNWSNPVS